MVGIEFYEVKNEERKGNNMAKSFIDLCNNKKMCLGPIQFLGNALVPASDFGLENSWFP